MKEKKFVPKRRFEGFNEEWEIKLLSEVANIVGGGTPSTSVKEYWDGEIDWYSPVEIGERIYVNESQKKITKYGFENSSTNILPIDTILFTSRAGIGKTAILQKEATTNQGFQSIVPITNKLNSYFIFSRSEELKKYGEKNGAGSTFLEISGKQLGKMPIHLPDIYEQQKIGEFFKHLDQMTSLEQSKLEKTKALKSAYLAEMFPAEGERAPKRRFAGFTDDWEQSKLKKFVELENGYAFKSKYFQFNITKEIVITPGNVNIGGGFQTGKGNYYDVAGNFPRKAVMKPGDIFVTMTDLTPSAQTLGFPAIIPNDGNVYLHNQRLGKLVNYDVNKDFLFNLLCTNQYRQQIVMTASGTTVKHSSPQRVLDSLVKIPSIEEQKAIGVFFKKIDDKIINQQQKLHKLKAMKQAYLEEMFV